MITAASWQAIAARLRPFIARRVAAADVDDVLQDVFVRVHRGLAGLRDDDRFTAWLFQIARSSLADHARQRARHPLTDPVKDHLASEANRFADQQPVSPGDDDDREAVRALADCISRFVGELPPPYREAITLVELDGLTAREAAGRLGISISGVKSRVQRGRDRLRDLLEQCCDIAVDARGKPTDLSPRDARCAG